MKRSGHVPQAPWVARVLFGISGFLIVLLAGAGCSKNGPESNGKILHMVLIDNVRTTDPAKLTDVVGADVIYQMYEPPYQYNYFSEDFQVIPLLADGMPKFSKDRLTMTFKIKKGVRFQDDPCFKETNGKGRELKASDFIYSWKRLANPKEGLQGFWTLDGHVAGINDFQKKFANEPEEKAMAEEVEGMKALDDETIQLKFLKPYPQILYVMTMTFLAPVAKEAVATYGADLTNHPVGTGPFKIVSYDPTSRIVLARNENYHDEFFPSADQLGPKYKNLAAYSGKKLPLVDGIDFTVVKEEQPRWLGFLNGKYDHIKIPKDNFDAAIRNVTEVSPDLQKKGVTVSIEPAVSYWYFSINMKDKLLGQNKYLRQAMASAIDATQWLHIFKNDRGSIQTEASPPAIKDRCGSPYRWTFNLKRAKELLAKAGYPEGKGLPILRFDTRGTDASERQLAEFLQKNLSEIGIRTEVVQNTFPAYLDKIKNGNTQLSKGGWVMDYPDAENNYQLFYGPNQAPGPNEANFDNPALNKLYEKMALMPSGPERRKLVCQMEQIIQEEVPWGYGIYENEYRLSQGWLKNAHTAFFIFTKMKYFDIDKSLRERTAK